MAESLYGHLFKRLSFKEGGLGSLRQASTITSAMLAYDVCVEYGCLWSAGQLGQAPYDAEIHDFDEVMLFMGADTSDLGYLGAEVEMLLGEEPEKQMITTATAIAIPKGLAHTPPNIQRMDDRFILMTVSVTPKMGGRFVHLEKQPTWVWGFQSRFKDHHQHLKFERNGPWHYGPKNADTHAGAITEVHGKDFEFHMSYESMRKAPYRFSPNPDKPHVHPYTEFLLFMGCDCNDLSHLGAEIEVYMGKEGERHVVSQPTIVVQPAGHPHLPQIVLKQEKPWIFCVIRPWGHMGEKPNPNLP